MSAALQQQLPLENGVDQGAQGTKKYPKKVAVRILDNDDDRELFDELDAAADEDNISISDRLRALIMVWKNDPALKVRVRKAAGVLTARKVEAANDARREAARKQFGKAET